jgi:hypothetical protein
VHVQTRLRGSELSRGDAVVRRQPTVIHHSGIPLRKSFGFRGMPADVEAGSDPDSSNSNSYRRCFQFPRRSLGGNLLAPSRNRLLSSYG